MIHHVSYTHLDVYKRQGIGSGLISYATAVGIMKSIVALVLLTFANKLSKKVRGEDVYKRQR